MSFCLTNFVKKLYVGLLLPLAFMDGEHFEEKSVGTSIWTKCDSSQWLDAKPNGSVIYVSFGSMVHVMKSQLEEIAMALKDNG